MAEAFETLEDRHPPDWFAVSDPPEARLGSGGGTAHLLAEAWRGTAPVQTFSQWLQSSRKLIIHGGGQSRRLPAYGPVGKLLMPVPVLRGSHGQRLDQTLLDLQLPFFHRVLDQAPALSVAMVASGDVLLECAPRLPALPAVDVLGLGMWVPGEKARHFGVFFADYRRPTELAFFLQKPPAARINELAGAYYPLVDTGVWLFSERALDVLMRRCGWTGQGFAGGRAAIYELYSEFGLSLGTHPVEKDPEINALTCAVVALPDARFHHFGTSRQMIESVSALQNRQLDQTRLGLTGAKRPPNVHRLNSRFELPLDLDKNHTLWVENSAVSGSWSLASQHVLTGVPENQWDLHLEVGVCLDFVPVGRDVYAVRFYGIDDEFRGPIGDRQTRWLGAPVLDWFARRGIALTEAGLVPDTDLQQTQLFPLLSREQLEPRWLEWLCASQPAANPAFATLWCTNLRVSAEGLGAEINLDRLYQERARRRRQCLLPMLRNARWSVFYRLDLDATAQIFAAANEPLPEPPATADQSEAAGPLESVHDRMFRSAVLRHRREKGWETVEQSAFARLRELIVREAQLQPVLPRCHVLEDQIIWGRSPVRLDLAGGWTDTPPYCLEFGGRVVNAAVDLNGQPPIQVFGKLCPRPELVLRSIDLGAEERIRTYAELDTFDQPGSPFGLAKAALALAGFVPRFHAHGGFPTLEAQLRDFGGGLELSMLSAVPKGSGLGTSSILAATLLATLGELCGLGWNQGSLFSRTLALEQMLTTGGGWQDQAGAIFRGLKLIETASGLSQKPNVRWLPPHLFNRDYANTLLLLYYTGVTRLAKKILQEIVRGIFLNSPGRLATITEIAANAMRASDALQACEYSALAEAVHQSWQLNQQLDAGTNPPETQRVLDQVGDWLAAAKLLGAGGGGFFLMLAKDEEAARRIRRSLRDSPPNPCARFVDFSLSETGLHLTRS
jgi:galactokinase/mevalonate kinase-like predicted kinase